MDPEWEAELEEDGGGENRPQVRRAARDYINGFLPQWNIVGVSSFAYSGTVYIVGIDLSSGEKHQTVNVVVRLFVKPDGKTTYWKADPVSAPLARTLRSGFERRRYQELEDELEEREERERGPD